VNTLAHCEDHIDDPPEDKDDKEARSVSESGGAPGLEFECDLPQSPAAIRWRWLSIVQGCVGIRQVVHGLLCRRVSIDCADIGPMAQMCPMWGELGWRILSSGSHIHWRVRLVCWGWQWEVSVYEKTTKSCTYQLSVLHGGQESRDLGLEGCPPSYIPMPVEQCFMAVIGTPSSQLRKQERVSTLGATSN